MTKKYSEFATGGDNDLTGLAGYDSSAPAATANKLWTADKVIENASSGFISFANNLVTTVIAAINTPVKIEGVTAAANLKDFDSPVSNQLRYIGTDPVTRNIHVSTSAFRDGGAGIITYRVIIRKNGVTDYGSSSSGCNPNNQGQAGFEFPVDFVTNDFIEIFIQNESNTANFIVDTLTMGVS